MLTQHAMLARLRAVCQVDERIVAATLYGSFAVGEADAFSDVECVLFCRPEALAVLGDRTGELSRRMGALIGRPPERDTPETVRRLAANFINLVLFGANVLERGELARALEVLSGISRYLPWMARLTEGATAHWPTPSRAWKQDLSSAAVSRLAACTAWLRRDELTAAYQAAWAWGVEMAAALSARHDLIWPQALVDRLADRMARLA